MTVTPEQLFRLRLTDPEALLPDRVGKRVAPLYVSRPLVNHSALREWAALQGLPPLDLDLHVTLAWSRTPVDWSRVAPVEEHLTIRERNGPRAVTRLGAEGAVVLRFESGALEERWRELLAAGASWDHPGFQPHVTLFFDPEGAVDLTGVEPYAGALTLGAERLASAKV